MEGFTSGVKEIATGEGLGFFVAIFAALALLTAAGVFGKVTGFLGKYVPSAGA